VLKLGTTVWRYVRTPLISLAVQFIAVKEEEQSVILFCLVGLFLAEQRLYPKDVKLEADWIRWYGDWWKIGS
jgi:hypothetical protein